MIVSKIGTLKPTTSAAAKRPGTSAASTKPSKPTSSSASKPSSSSSKISKPTTSTKPASSAKPSSKDSSSLSLSKKPSKPVASSKSASQPPPPSSEELQRLQEQRLAREEAAAAERARLNGEITLRYNHYKEQFTIVNGCISSAAIDDKFSLSFAFPKAIYHLTWERPDSYDDFDRPTVTKTSETEFAGLESGKTYWVLIEEDTEEAHKAAERQKAYVERMAREKAEQDKQPLLHAEKMESCSCIEGNPCAQPYNCKDWKSRYDVAKAHGWKGHS